MYDAFVYSWLAIMSIEKDILQCFPKEKLDNVQKQVEMILLFQVNSTNSCSKLLSLSLALKQKLR